MNALDLLRDDHRRISQLIQEIENELNAQTGQTADESLKRLTRALNLHKRMLHEYLYPELEPFNEVSAYLALESRNETELHGLINEVEQNQPPEQGWTMRLAQIGELWQAHVDQNEKQLFPEALRLLGPTRLQQLQYDMDSVRTHQSNLDSAVYTAARLGPKN
jgi:hypothetical protein